MFKAAVLVLSDKGSRGEREDKSGRVIRELLGTIGGEVMYYEILPDEKEVITEKLLYLCDHLRVDLVLTSGGTGMSQRDVTPEATLAVTERLVPGLGEAMRAYGIQKTPHAILSRGIAGIRRSTLIVNLPGSVKGSRESLEAILPALGHGLGTLKGETVECGQE